MDCLIPGRLRGMGGTAPHDIPACFRYASTIARTDVLTQRQWYVVSTFPVRCKPKTESNTWLLWRLWADPIMEEPDCGGIKEIIVWIKILVSECEYMYRFSYFCTFI